MEEKTYTISGKDLNALVKAAEIIQAFLVKHYGDKRMQEFDAEAVLKSLAQPEPEEKTQCHCHCHRVHGEKHVILVRKPTTLADIAKATGASYKQVQSYAYKHGIGMASRNTDGHQVRILTASDAKKLMEKFKK